MSYVSKRTVIRECRCININFFIQHKVSITIANQILIVLIVINLGIPCCSNCNVVPKCFWFIKKILRQSILFVSDLLQSNNFVMGYRFRSRKCRNRKPHNH